MTKLRKAFVVSVMFATVLTMSVVVVPEANAASAGDLIKMDGLSSVYYLGADGKRYVFPNETTYFSWYSDFSSVVTIVQSELESYSLGANVTIRPGTKLVKITTNPKVYAVEPGGILKWVPDEATALALFGTTWAQRVVDVPDAFFFNYDDSSSDTVSATAYPAGSLVKFGGEADTYYIDASGNARKVATEAAFEANRFNWDDVITSSLTLPTAGTEIAAVESDLTDTSEGAGGTALAGTGLTIALASDTPASRNIPSGAHLVPFVTVNFTAASDGDVTVQSLVLTRQGAGATTDFDGGYLYVGDTRLTNKRSVNSSDHTMTFTALNLSIPAGTTKAVTLKMTANTGNLTGNHYFELNSASNVTTDGAVVSGSFPIAGNTMAYSTVDAGQVTLTPSGSTYTRKIGETGVLMDEFTLVNNSLEIVNIHRLRLKQEGDGNNDVTNNYSLDLDGTIVAEGVPMADKYIDFMLATPYEIKKGKNVLATVQADIVTGIGKTVRFYLKNEVDAEIRGTAYGDFYGVDISNAMLTTTGSLITIAGSEINASFDGPAAQNVKDDTDDVVLANFKIKTENLDVNIEQLRVVLTNGIVNNLQIQNVEMVDSGNNIAFSVADPASSTVPAALTENLDFENIYLAAGVQYNFEIRGDIQDATGAGSTFQVGINFGAGATVQIAKFQDADETAVVVGDYSSASLTGRDMTVAAPSVIFSKVTTSDATYVENTDKVLLYKGKITAGAADDLTVTKVKFGATLGAGTLDSYLEKMYLYTVANDLGTPLDTETSLTGVSSVSFSGFNLTIPKGTSHGVVIVVRGDVKNNPTANDIELHWNNGLATTTNFTVRDTDNSALVLAQYSSIAITEGQKSTIAAKGTYTMTMDLEMTGLYQDQNALAGTRKLVGRIKLTAQKEEVTIEDFVLHNYTGYDTNLADADTVAYLKLFGESSMATELGSASLSSNLAVYEDVNITIPTVGIKYIYIGADIKSIDYTNSPSADATATASTSLMLRIASSTTGLAYMVKAVGVSTGEILTHEGVGSTTPTKLTNILGATVSNVTSAFANGLLANGTARDIFSFKVTAPSSSNLEYDGTALGIKLATTTFTVASSSGVTLATFKVQRVGGANGETAAKYAGVTSTLFLTASDTFVINLGDTYGTDADLIIRPGETAEYVVRANIAGVGSNDSLQITLENIDTNNFTYVHNIGSNGSDLTYDTMPVYTLLTGITSVRGGALTN